MMGRCRGTAKSDFEFYKYSLIPTITFLMSAL